MPQDEGKRNEWPFRLKELAIATTIVIMCGICLHFYITYLSSPEKIKCAVEDSKILENFANAAISIKAMDNVDFAEARALLKATEMSYAKMLKNSEEFEKIKSESYSFKASLSSSIIPQKSKAFLLNEFEEMSKNMLKYGESINITKETVEEQKSTLSELINNLEQNEQQLPEGPKLPALGKGQSGWICIGKSNKEKNNWGNQYNPVGVEKIDFDNITLNNMLKITTPTVVYEKSRTGKFSDGKELFSLPEGQRVRIVDGPEFSKRVTHTFYVWVKVSID